MEVLKSAPESGSFGILPVATLAGVPAVHLGTCKTRIWEHMAPVRSPPWSYFGRCGSAEKSDVDDFELFGHPGVVGRVPTILMDFGGFLA